MLKKREAYFSLLHTNLGSCPNVTQRQHCRTDATPSVVTCDRGSLSYLF